MNDETEQLGLKARRAVQAQDWPTVMTCAAAILRQDAQSAEGNFLAALVAKTARRPNKAIELFEKVLEIEPDRYDAAVELADLYTAARRNADAARLLAENVIFLHNSPRYLDMAGTVYTEIGMPEHAWPLYLEANKLQPAVELFQANLANCAVSLGKIDDARTLYLNLLERNPGHQRNHYHLSRLEKARDETHIKQMLDILQASTLPPGKQVFLCYAIGKEYEDLEQWSKAFSFYRNAGNGIAKVAKYDLTKDIELIDTAIEVCNAQWLATGQPDIETEKPGKTPIFITGLPRTGTTLTERIVSSHSQVKSLGETPFLQVVMRRTSEVSTPDAMNPAIIRAVAERDIALVRDGYLNAVAYRLEDEPMFIDKLPLNILHLGFIAKAFPDGKIVHLQRHPLDACLAMYKQLFTWNYKFSYKLEDLGNYYIAYDRLLKHWREVLGDRLIEVRYEDLVSNLEPVTRELLTRLGLEFETACLEFDQNPAASTTASSVQVRDKVHTGSIDKWRHFEQHLAPLKQQLESAGILPV